MEEVKFSEIVFDKTIFPREDVDRKRVSNYVESMKEGDIFPAIEVDEIEVENKEKQKEKKYRIIDGAHRYHAYKEVGTEIIKVEVIDLNGQDPLLVAAKKTGEVKELNNNEAEDVARRLFKRNDKIDVKDIARAVKRSKSTVYEYIKDLLAEIELKRDIKIMIMDKLGIPQERMAERLGIPQPTLHGHLSKIPELENPINADLKRNFPVDKVAEKFGWPEPLVWNLALQNKTDQERFKILKWGFRTWNDWSFNDCDKRFGDDWPGRIPAQLVAHTLIYCTEQGQLVFDPMAGGGVVADTCLAMNRKCWSFDSNDRPDSRPEIEPYIWKNPIEWAVKSKEKPDLVFFDPPYFSKKDKEYQECGDGSISGFDRIAYLEFFKEFFIKAHENTKASTWLAFLNAPWYDFEGTAFKDENPDESIRQSYYEKSIEETGWKIKRVVDCPLSSERFNAGVVSAMQEKKILGVVTRYLTIAIKG